MDYKIVLDSIINVSKNAGQSILDIYNDENKFNNIEIKKDNSPLTLADKASNNIICSSLKKLYPDIPILSEEGTTIDYYERKKWNNFWLIDPLDGTKEFIKRNGEFTVNIALIKDSKPILGVVYAPVLDITWYGSKDIGSFKIEGDSNSKKINVINSIDNNKNIKIVSSRSHSNNPKLKEYTSQFNKFELIKMGSSIKICLVADGSAHYYPRFGPTMEWDTAAAHAIVKYAGGNILNINSKLELRYNKENLLNPGFLVHGFK